MTLAAPPVTITTNWCCRAYRNNLEIQVPSQNFYDAWGFLRQLYGAPVSVQQDAADHRRGSFKDTPSGMTVELRQNTNCAVIHVRKPKS